MRSRALEQRQRIPAKLQGVPEHTPPARHLRDVAGGSHGSYGHLRRLSLGEVDEFHGNRRHVSHVEASATADLDRSRRFYRDVLGLAVYREFGPPAHPAVVFFLGQGLLEVSGNEPVRSGSSVMIWLQVRDVRAEHGRLTEAGVRVLRAPAAEPWGLTEMWIEDPAATRDSHGQHG